MKNSKTFYRLITPDCFANKNYSTLDQAIEGKKEFGTGSGEYVEYWKQQGEKSKIVKVTETIEEIEIQENPDSSGFLPNN